MVADLAGRRWLAFALVVATGLLRPEMLLFVVGYRAWLAWSDRRISTVAIVAGVAVVIVAAWLIPEKIGSGELLRAASRARAPVPDSPAQAAFPFLATFTNAAPVVPWVVYVGGVDALVVAEVRRRRVSLPLVLAAIATTLMVVVAAMTQGGFSGNPRYLTIPIALTCVLGGAGWVWLYRTARSRASARGAAVLVVVAAAAAAPVVIHDARRLRGEMRNAFNENASLRGAAGRDRARRRSCGGAALRHGLHDPVRHTGGRPRAAGAPGSGQYPRPAAGTILARRAHALASDRRFRRWRARAAGPSRHRVGLVDHLARIVREAAAAPVVRAAELCA